MPEFYSKSKSLKAEINLPISKSQMNRYLICKKLANGDLPEDREDFPNDVRLMLRALNNAQDEIHVHDAGTVMRFCTAFYACKSGTHILTGSERMQERPIVLLVDALRQIGADIEYVGNEGFPPLRIHGGQLDGGRVRISGDVSSQYISALLMIAPLCKNPVEIEVMGRFASKPYVDMTLSVMKKFGIHYQEKENIYILKPQDYSDVEMDIERDWSSASFIYEIAALSEDCDIYMPALSINSVQGDRILADHYSKLGVRSVEHEGGIRIQKSGLQNPEAISIDFQGIPDLLMPITFTCLGCSIALKASGLLNLHLKESNRLEAISDNVESLGASFDYSEQKAELIPRDHLKTPNMLEVHNDHRMAMSMVPLTLKCDSIRIDDSNVVSKSFPAYWKEVKKLGILPKPNG